MVAHKARAALGCEKEEFDRWARDGRLPPDGAMALAGSPGPVTARAWLPATIGAARAEVDRWRAMDQADAATPRHRSKAA